MTWVKFIKWLYSFLSHCESRSVWSDLKHISGDKEKLRDGKRKKKPQKLHFKLSEAKDEYSQSMFYMKTKHKLVK